MNEPILSRAGSCPKERFWDTLFCLGIFVFSFSYYSSSLVHTFYADDPIWIYLGKKFLSDGVFSSYPFYYRPLVTVSFAVQYLFFKTNYLYYHIFSIVLFASGTCLFFILAKIVFKNRLIAYTITFFSALSPLNFDKINWIGMQSYLWESVFYLTVFIGFILYIEKNKKRYFLIYHLAFAGVLWTNETGIMMVPLLAVLYFSVLKEKEVVFHRKDLLKYFAGIFFLLSLYGYLYAFKVYPQYLYFQSTNPNVSWEKVAEFFNFWAIKLSYIVLLFPLGSIFFEIKIFSYFIVLGLLLLLIVASWKCKWLILWCVLPLSLSYFSPGKNDWLTSIIPVSSLGVWMLLGCGMKHFFYCADHFLSKSLKNLFFGVCILLFAYMAVYFFELADAMDVKHLRQSNKYSYYTDIVKKTYPRPGENLEVYFVDGSSFVNFNADGDLHSVNFISYSKCKGNEHDFDYLSFLYHLKLLHNSDDVKGFAVSERDITALSNHKNVVILRIDRN